MLRVASSTLVSRLDTLRHLEPWAGLPSCMEAKSCCDWDRVALFLSAVATGIANHLLC
jgi:hypothetical protein